MTAQSDQRKSNTIAKEKVAYAIEDIKERMDCPTNFECVRSKFSILCKARDFGLKNYVECGEAEPQRCCFAMSFGETYFCKCPMRVYIAKELRK